MALEPYTAPNLLERILDALTESGATEPYGAEDLAPVDQFHIGGAQESAALLELSGIAHGMRVLDVGCGLGGPGRMLARFGCRVLGVDFSQDYCRVASDLTERSGLSEAVAVMRADATCLPIAGIASFDACWLEHVNMNISDKRMLVREAGRVLAPGGLLAFHEVFQGKGQVLYPTPWAHVPESSFLIASLEFRELLTESGFGTVDYLDRTAVSADWFSTMLAKRHASGLRPLGIHLLFGEHLAEIMQNMEANLTERRVEVGMGVARKSV